MAKANLWDLVVNGLGLLGIVALSVPALYANKYGRLLYRISQLNPTGTALIQKKAKLEDDLRRLRDGWTIRNSLLLIGGTGLTALSYAVAIAKAFVVKGP